MNIPSKMASLWKKLKNKKFRDAFVAAQFKRSIPFQITAIRKKLGWSQEQLAKAAKLTQGVISRAENPDYGNLTFNSVLRIAAGLDVAVIIEFVPFSKLLEVFENRSEDLAAATFEEEDKALSRNEIAANHTLTAETGSYNVIGANVTVTLGSVVGSSPIPSQTTITEEIVEALKPSISQVERIVRGVSSRKPSSAQESMQEQQRDAA